MKKKRKSGCRIDNYSEWKKNKTNKTEEQQKIKSEIRISFIC